MTAAAIAGVAFWRLRKRVVRDLPVQGSILLTQTLQARSTAASQPARRILTELSGTQTVVPPVVMTAGASKWYWLLRLVLTDFCS